MEDETYHSQYYTYLQQLVSEYIDGGGFDAFYERVRSQIDELVKTDPTAFYSYDEYLTAADTLYQVVKMRGQSIQGQLDGSIPSTEEAQRSSDALVDASTLDISVMGSMNTGGGGGGLASTHRRLLKTPQIRRMRHRILPKRRLRRMGSPSLEIHHPLISTHPSSTAKCRMDLTHPSSVTNRQADSIPLN